MVNTQSLTASLFSQLQSGPALQQVSQQLGMDSGQASQAISAALPLLMGGLANNASQPQGAQSLLNALQRDHLGSGGGGFDLGGLLGSVLGGGAATPSTNGAGILGHVFGGQTPQAASLLGQKTGLDSGRSGQLLMILAPIVMSFLAKQFAQQGNANQLSQALGEENRQTGGGGIGDLLGGVLDQDGDGKFGVSDVLGLLGGKR
ncbi:DUF937 domain-containing protein [Stenotrophomonas oahuensis]|uniref:DUF937 domain-containing protein n=1 Tax=Stenotrophomonas oahuensis TaxID=3003271 RepID=A0ABY9YUW6_9GAMM|nr:DUF937 domain-containing protein [Stenotrophomonas sp. A5586]WNH54702.1 DUF937 domain-containing protein [Stenotrophomonas sp. A5586]